MEKAAVVELNKEIAQHASRKNLDAAMALFHKAEGAGSANSHTYAAAINANIRCGSMAGAAEFVRKDVVEGSPAIVTTLGTLYLDLASTVDAAAEKIRLTKELDAIAKHIAGTEARLGNEAFVSKAPPAVLEGARRQLADQKAKQTELSRLLAALG